MGLGFDTNNYTQSYQHGNIGFGFDTHNYTQSYQHVNMGFGFWHTQLHTIISTWKYGVWVLTHTITHNHINMEIWGLGFDTHNCTESYQHGNMGFGFWHTQLNAIISTCKWVTMKPASLSWTLFVLIFVFLCFILLYCVSSQYSSHAVVLALYKKGKNVLEVVRLHVQLLAKTAPSATRTMRQLPVNKSMTCQICWEYLVQMPCNVRQPVAAFTNLITSVKECQVWDFCCVQVLSPVYKLEEILPKRRKQLLAGSSSSGGGGGGWGGGGSSSRPSSSIAVL